MHPDSSLWNNIKKNISIPNDYNTLINDPQFETLITEAIIGRAIVKNDFERTMRSVEECIEAIDRYLDKQ